MILTPLTGAMKKEMSAFDVRAVVEELSALEGAFVDKIFHWGKGEFLMRLNVQGDGKRELHFKGRTWLFLPEKRPQTPQMPTNFATHLRKHISNARIGRVRQQGFDRVVCMELLRADGAYHLFFELFGGGNLILVRDGKIVDCLVRKAWRQRTIRPGEDYIMPEPRFDPLAADKDGFVALLEESKTDLVRTLATGVNLGGQYAEEVCLRSGVPKNNAAAELSAEEVEAVWKALDSLRADFASRDGALLLTRDGEPEDVTPVRLGGSDDLEAEAHPSLSAALEAFHAMVKEDEEESYEDPELLRLQRRMDMQQQSIDEFKQEAEDLRLRADALYTDYAKADELLKVLAEQSSKLGWDKLREGAMRIPFVKDIDPAKHIIRAELGGSLLSLDYRLSLDANASALYQKGKDLGERALRAEEALKGTRAQYDRRQKGLEKIQARRAKAQPTKQFWFERYKWYVGTGGRLVISGRDARSNDQVVKRHLKEGDYYLHADLHGAPSVIMKDGPHASEEEVREAAIFSVSQSKAWSSRFVEGSAYWVFADQVSKSAEAGEFVPRGAFIIRGKRNYHHHLKLELAVGEVEHEGARKVMCAPVRTMEQLSRKYIVIGPGVAKKGCRNTADIARAFEVPEEEVARILPPGGVEIRSLKTIQLGE